MPDDLLDEAAVRGLLERRCREVGGRAEWARQVREYVTVVNECLSGKRRPSPRILAELGLERVISYRKKGGK